MIRAEAGGAAFDDVLLAVDYVLARADVDRDRVVIAGHSAGGHLALLAASERELPVIAMAAGSDLGGVAERRGTGVSR